MRNTLKMLKENKPNANTICEWINNSNERYDKDTNEILINIINFFLNRSINIIMDHCYNEESTGCLYIK